MGDVIKINDIVVEIETSKSIVELPSPYGGTVSALLAAEGDLVEVGKPIISIEDGVGGGNPAGCSGSGGRRGRVPNLIGYGAKAGETRRRPRRGSHPAEPMAAESHEEFASSLSSASAVSRPVDTREPLHAAPAAPVGAPLPAPGPRRSGTSPDRRRHPGQAAGAQAGQGSRRRPGHPDRHRSRRRDHPGRRARRPSTGSGNRSALAELRARRNRRRAPEPRRSGNS